MTKKTTPQAILNFVATRPEFTVYVNNEITGDILEILDAKQLFWGSKGFNLYVIAIF